MSGEFLTLLIAGITLGFSSGIAPGPLLALTISETFRYGMKSGLKVAVAPLITDTPIVIGAILLLTEVKELSYSLAILSIVGSLFLAYFGYENIRTKLSLDSIDESKITSLQKAIIANFLNPNPYLFWITIGGPLFLSGVSISVWNGIVFIFTFYLMLVGVKIIIVLVGHRMTRFFKSTKYLYVVRATGVLLLIFAVLLFLDGLNSLKIL